ncbi:methyl-accepting chemotaxis protein [Desulforamulus aquiferis]|uniref:Methyl-accepting chemotaxis protein n=1 Tax=Desulforamulus aquiferis TaxID=1397668 RepID=A0AAW7ZF69_9FIRM|nr:methyl-accepting chemotaxis protein [Desulforamulus aquiferis]MDO7787799.1 methyl-accepting chemotaxis protein [Desulforamulus aquiferis]RYD02227.1 hypothetical protein N752_25790 [Desulforamulus aquiferis]
MNLTVKHRLFLAFGLLIIITLSLGLYANFTLQVVNDKSLEITSTWLPGVELAGDIETLVADIRINEFRHIAATREKDINEMEELIANNKQEIENYLAEYEKNVYDNHNKNLLIVTRSEWRNFLEADQRVINLSRENKNQEAMDTMQQESQALYSYARHALADLVNYNQDNADKASLEVHTLHKQSQSLLLSAILIAALLGISAAYFISRSITTPLKNIEKNANMLAAGDLTVEDIRVKGKNEISSLADSFNSMKNNLNAAIGHLAVTAREISETSSGLASQAEQTSAAATENAATVEEIATTIDQVAQDSNNVSSVSTGISQKAMKGNEGIEQLNKQITIISTSSEKASGVIENLSQTLNKVGQIVNLITGIADQTNLLALNAAIEAARAGEQGRGFAVVAEEVRKLAEQSSNAAKQITGLIQNVQTESQLAVETMNQGNHEVTLGVQVANEVGEILTGILSEIGGLSEKIHDVAAASEQVSAGVENVASSTEEQTAAMQEVSASTENLKKMASDIDQLVNKFKL